jgi:hypothetical protein
MPTTPQTPAQFTRPEILAALDRFIKQRSGLDARNYGDRESLMSDYRPILRDGKVARQFLRFVELRESITAEMLIEGTRSFSGRLQFTRDRKGNCVVDYCTGQYFPTEYRRAACCVLARTIQEYLFPDAKDNADIRQKAKREFGRAIATRYF